uniref:hypothetical protein n=1 Tax=Streptomyces tubercidicus TaxID=47759 RepID=UPI0030DE1036|nr:hypothetical protein OG690_37805 [Streptomyces tubercidicus]
MATATVPAAVPDPDEPHTNATSNAPSGLLASMLAPVEPARPATFNIPAPTTPEGDGDVAVSGASSASYHGTEEAGETTQSGSGNSVKKGVLRALLLAAATRWAKGGGYQNKRLDVEKAKATRQPKEDRKVSVNRTDAPSGKVFGGSGSGGNVGGGNSGGGKGNSGGADKGPVKGPVKGPKNSTGNGHQGPQGRSGKGDGAGRSGSGTGRGASGGGSTGGNGSHGNNGSSGRGPTPKNPKQHDTSNGHGRDQKPSKVDLSKGRGSRSGPDGGKASGGGSGATGQAGASGNASKTNGSGKGGSNRSPKAPNGGTSAGDNDGKSPARGGGSSKDHKGRADTKDRKDTDGQDTTRNTDKTPDKERRGTKDGKQPAPTDKDSQTKPGKTEKAGADGTDTSRAKKPGADSGDTKTDKGPNGNGKDPKSGKENAQPQAKPEPGVKPDGKPFSVKESREAGYRDGTRAAKAVAQARAYRDGVKDGYRDVTEAAERQKTALDQAHEDRKKAQDKARTKEQDVSGSGSTADHHQPQPIEVKQVDSNNVWLGEGADRNVLGRGEVRTLKSFERRLEAKANALTKIAEGAKGLKAHAEQQATRATQLLEAAKSVKGGEKLVAALVKQEETAKIQANKADEIHKRAVRAAERCASVLANVKARYGGMYKAVVDSDEKIPGEMSFYRDGGTTHG